MIKNIIAILITLLFTENVNATVKQAYEIYTKDLSKFKYKRIAHELIDGQFYFSSIPYINRYLGETSEIDPVVEKDIEILVMNTGTMAVLNLEESKLQKFNIPSVFLILGTRLFNKEKYDESYTVLSKIPDQHAFSLEASYIKGTIKNLDRKNVEALFHYNTCIEKAKRKEDESKTEKLKRYYTFLKESCLIRTARLKIETKEYEQALNIYNSIDKRSYRFPYALMDMAWANYYLNDYNRTLGLTVTFKSPLLDSYFFPEGEVLTALAYYNLCQFDDALNVVDNFYEVYKPKAEALKDILGKNKLSETYFLNLYYADSEKREALNPFIRNLITQTRKQVRFNLDLNSLKSAKEELALMKKLKTKNSLTDEMEINLENTINFISLKINSYIKREIFTFINEIHKHSYSMFNLQLELLAKKRDEIYQGGNKLSDRSRGSDKNIKRKIDQYYFDFNGSFWADELGDYSFGLDNKCNTKKE
jgi:hypothetical protein